MSNITASNPTYLYQPHDSDDNRFPRSWFAYRVVKTTERFVYVYSRSCGIVTPTPDGLKLNPHKEIAGEGSHRIPRAELEREGQYMIKGKWWEVYYLEPEFPVIKAPDCIAALGLTVPCAVDEIKRAYRQLAKNAHPDSGGTAPQFLALQQNYEQALRWVEGVRA
jgi:hypothetical protein